MGELRDRMVARKARAKDRMKVFVATQPDEYFKNLNESDEISRDELVRCVLSWDEKTIIDMSYDEYMRLKKWAEDYTCKKITVAINKITNK